LILLPLLKIAGAIAGKMLSAFFVDYFFIFLYIFVIIFFRSQYQKYSELQGDIYGKPVKTLREITERMILTGLVAGFISSILIVAAGITIETETVRFLVYLMFFMLFFDLRFVCISYAAGLLAASNLIFGYPDVNIPSLLGLVAILHFTESVLVYINRKSDCIPVYFQYDNEITGAFLIRRFWMVPAVFFTYVLQNGETFIDGLGEWQLFFNPDTLRDGAYVLGLDCLIAVLCYSDTAITQHPEKKCTQSSIMLFCYSTLLMLLAVLSIYNSWAVYAGVIFSVAAHEGISVYSKITERRRKPLYSAVRRGLRILDILPGSHAELMGLQRGDIILSINNNDIQTEEGVSEALREFPVYTWIRVLGWDGRERTVEYRCYPGGYNSLGIISVPREKEVTYNIWHFEHISILRDIVNRFRGMDRQI